MRGYVEGLREQGMTIGEDVVMFGCVFDKPYRSLITIGNECSLDAAEILCHDDSCVRSLGRTSVAPVVLGDKVWVGHRALILAGVTIGANSIVGACSVVTRDVPEGTVVAGNPARPIGTYEELMRRRAGSDRLVPYDLPRAQITGRHRAGVIEAALAMYRDG